MTRREARKETLSILFQVDVGDVPLDEALADLRERTGRWDREVPFVEGLCRGVVERVGELDKVLDSFAPGWPSSRMAAADRNVLRMACYELLYGEGTPLAVAINEAVVLVKEYGDARSGKFVNGILGAVARALEEGTLTSVTEGGEKSATVSHTQDARTQQDGS